MASALASGHSRSSEPFSFAYENGYRSLCRDTHRAQAKIPAISDRMPIHIKAFSCQRSGFWTYSVTGYGTGTESVFEMYMESWCQRSRYCVRHRSMSTVSPASRTIVESWTWIESRSMTFCTSVSVRCSITGTYSMVLHEHISRARNTTANTIPKGMCQIFRSFGFIPPSRTAHKLQSQPCQLPRLRH